MDQKVLLQAPIKITGLLHAVTAMAQAMIPLLMKIRAMPLEQEWEDTQIMKEPNAPIVLNILGISTPIALIVTNKHNY